MTLTKVPGLESIRALTRERDVSEARFSSHFAIGSDSVARVHTTGFAMPPSRPVCQERISSVVLGRAIEVLEG